MIKKYTFSTENKVTSLLVDGFYVWIAFLGSSGESHLYKSSVFNTNLRYFSLDVEADEITRIFADDNYIYLSLDSDTYTGKRINKSDPIGDSDLITIHSGITEKAIDLIGDNQYLYFLTPGVASGENAKLVRYNKSTLAYIETIDLIKSGEQVNDAKKIDIDQSGNIWVISETDPVILTKVFNISGWDFTNYILS